MLVALVKNEVRVLVHKLLHRILYELVERVELLPDETFLLEEAGDHRPAIFLRDLFVFLNRFIVWDTISSVGLELWWDWVEFCYETRTNVRVRRTKVRAGWPTLTHFSGEYSPL